MSSTGLTMPNCDMSQVAGARPHLPAFDPEAGRELVRVLGRLLHIRWETPLVPTSARELWNAFNFLLDITCVTCLLVPVDFGPPITFRAAAFPPLENGSQRRRVMSLDLVVQNPTATE